MSPKDSKKNKKLVDQTLSHGDGGDDPQRRFRYQNMMAASISLRILDDTNPIEEVCCEQKDDVLVKLKEGVFDAVQVKTREGATKGLFTANDQDVIKAISKFVILDRDYPGRFRRFHLITNERFWQRKKDGTNLPNLIEISRDLHSDVKNDGNALLSSYGKKIGDPLGLDASFVVETLGKIRIDVGPKLGDMVGRLMEDLIRVRPQLDDRPHAELRRIAQELIAMSTAAASTCMDDTVKAYFSFCEDPEACAERSVIESKRITGPMLDEIIQKVLTFEYTLPSRNQVSSSTLPKGTRKTQLKLTKGGISKQSINLAKENKYHAEFLLAKWSHKLTEVDADRRYQHLRSIALTECTEAFDDAYSAEEPFGSLMLTKVRKRIRKRVDDNRDELFDCSYEHLMGMVSILTEECTVWWSDPFPVSGESQP